MVLLLRTDSHLPDLSIDEIQQYLCSGLFRGIGKRTAQMLVNYFGSDTLLVLDKNPEKLNEIPGLNRYRINNITHAWSQSKSNPSFAAIAQLLAVGTPLGLTLRICDHYGHRTSDVLKSDPYKLADELDGIGFKTADKLALSLGVPAESETRYEKGLLQVLKDALGEGHCFLPESQLLRSAASLLEHLDHTPDYESLRAVVNRLTEKQTLVRGESANSIYLKAALRAEVSVAIRIKTLISRPTKSTQDLENWLASTEFVSHRELSRLSEEQISALIMAQKHPMSIITGGPGRGKTYVLKTLVEWLQLNNASFAQAAPTGKAANRMQNATNAEATTLHRLLQWLGHGQSFLFNEDNLLDLDWLIIDEFSMVDIFLFNSVLKALSPKTQLLLVGDQDQLPSVGAGMVLRDLLASEMVPTTRLQTIYRQRHESPIIYAANDVNQGIVPAVQKFALISSWMDVGDCAMLEADNPHLAAAIIVELGKAIQAEGVDLNQQVTVLAPQKEGVAGVHNLNKLLQPIFNPKKDNQPEVEAGSVVYRVGDRVIQLKNRYDTYPAVMNGETGRVIFVDCEKKLIKISFEGGAVVNYNPGCYEQILHSFCVTCHKSQGSEFPYVIFPILKSNYRMLTRQLIYTTMTRAQGTFIAVGQTSALEHAVATNKPAKRFTSLINHLISPLAQLEAIMKSLSGIRTTSAITPQTVTIASRLRQLGLKASTGQMTAIGSLALQMYESKYGYRPSKRLEQVGDFRFKTYHYEVTAVELIDCAIDSVLGEEASGKLNSSLT